MGQVFSSPLLAFWPTLFRFLSTFSSLVIALFAYMILCLGGRVPPCLGLLCAVLGSATVHV